VPMRIQVCHSPRIGSIMTHSSRHRAMESSKAAPASRGGEDVAGRRDDATPTHGTHAVHGGSRLESGLCRSCQSRLQEKAGLARSNRENLNCMSSYQIRDALFFIHRDCKSAFKQDRRRCGSCSAPGDRGPDGGAPAPVVGAKLRNEPKVGS
jgi:hypothetical protein